MSQKLNRVAVFTSGGDAPGMNAALRAVVRIASHYEIEVVGIEDGYEGMIDGTLKRLEIRDVGNILQRGGTFLRTARSQRFMTEAGRQQAFNTLKKNKIDACIALGGNGTFTGAELFNREFNMPMIGIPCTIDNDLYGTDYTIGFDTALNTAIEAVDKIRDTAESHSRLFFIEVMGRNSGFLALHTAIGSGAGHVLLPEKKISMEEFVSSLKKAAKRKKLMSLVIVAEGNPLGSAEHVAHQVSEMIEGIDARVTVIGHLQRGGSPSGYDRLLASRLGQAALKALVDGHKNVMVGIDNNQVRYTPLNIAVKNEKEINLELMKLAEMLAI